MKLSHCFRSKGPVKAKYIFRLLIVMIATNILTVVFLYRANGLVQLKPVDDLSIRSLHYDVIMDSNAKKLREELSKARLLKQSGEAEVLDILRWVMSLTEKLENNPNRSGWDILQSIKQGHGVLCGQISQLFIDALEVAGIPARRVIMKQSLFLRRNNNHTTVEVLVNNKWRLYDPTFHIVLTNKSGERVGLSELQSALFKGRKESIKPEFLGEVLYPPRLENYYIRYVGLSNYLFIEHRYLSKLKAIFNNEFPAVWFYQENEQGNLTAINYYNILYNFGMKIIPAVILLLLLIIIYQRDTRRGSMGSTWTSMASQKIKTEV